MSIRLKSVRFLFLVVAIMGGLFTIVVSQTALADEFLTMEVIDLKAVDGGIVDRSDYSWPPRCGPRNCVAMCVTCGYDICRSSGGSIEQCQQQREFCKQSCTESQLQDCPTSDPDSVGELQRADYFITDLAPTN